MASPLGAYAIFGKARGAYNRGDIAGAAALIADIDTDGRPMLRGEINRLLGMCAFSRGDLAAARSHYETMVAAFDQIADAELRAGAWNMLATLKRYIGDYRGSWSDRLHASRLAQQSDSRRLRHTLLGGMAIAAASQGLHRAAVALFRVKPLTPSEALAAKTAHLKEKLAKLATEMQRDAWAKCCPSERVRLRLSALPQPASGPGHR